MLSLTGVLTVLTSNEAVVVFPNQFPKPHYDLEKNPISKNKILLGRTLFYDPILSKDNSISCASCHSPYNAFAHTDHRLSHGINDQVGNRNAPALFNLAWQKHFNWDGAINHLDMQALAPLNNTEEMGETTSRVINKLSGSKIYSELFFKAYGDSSINTKRMLKALAQFQLSLISSDSKYDKMIKGSTQFNAQELSGYALFKSNCNTCHKEPLFTTGDFEFNGLSIDTFLNDFGKGAISMRKEDSLLFKIPSLRNLSYTYPYMHDGRFSTLSEVLNHYTSSNLVENPFSDKKLEPMHLSAEENRDIIAFLLTLNDKTFIFNRKNKFPKEILLSE